jgi:signal transduction histidine kinase
MDTKSISAATSVPADFATRITKTRPGRILLAVLAWSILGCLFALPSISARGNWRMYIILSLAQWWSWGLVAPFIVAVDGRLPFTDKQLGRRLFVQLLLSALFTSAYIYVFALLRAALGLGPWSALLNTRVLAAALQGMFLWSWLVYWLIWGSAQAFRYYQRYLSSELRAERLERSFSDARLNALRMQLDPHFLFNALNTISSQVERDPKLARGMIEHLGDLLRMSLDSKNRPEIPLAEEIAFLDHYLAIQKIRFGDQLKIDIQIQPDVKYATVPCLLVQPLVENAIKHGTSKRSTGGQVTLSAHRVGKELEISIFDDGVGLPPGWSMDTSAGIGLSVTRERIASLHPNGRSHFSVHRRAVGGTEVRISLPLRFEQGEADKNGGA